MIVEADLLGAVEKAAEKQHVCLHSSEVNLKLHSWGMTNVDAL